MRSILSDKHTEMLVHSVITSRLDYCNSVFVNLDAVNINKLQKVQNAAAGLTARRNRRSAASELLSKLHWLNIRPRVAFKIMLLTYKCVTHQCSNNFEVSYKTHNCRPNDLLMLDLKYAVTKYGKRTFWHTSPRLWNALPVYIRTAESLERFKKLLKTFLFQNLQFVKKTINW